jgi:hypothetical protein
MLSRDHFLPAITQQSYLKKLADDDGPIGRQFDLDLRFGIENIYQIQQRNRGAIRDE